MRRILNDGPSPTIQRLHAQRIQFNLIMRVEARICESTTPIGVYQASIATGRSTQVRQHGSISREILGVKLAYHWDAARARCAWTIKVIAVLIAATVTAGLPVWIVVKAIDF